MKFHYANLETCHTATGVIVVIDVIRAFTNAAFAFGRGAKAIYPVGTVEEALQLRTAIPNSLVCGEVGGVPPKEFDFGNSPTQTNTLELSGRTVIQRTSAGTQGIVQSVNATNILAASFVVAKATTKYIQKLSPEFVTFVITGQYGIDGGDEDLACAGYLEALLSGQNPDRNPFTERVFKSRDARRHLDPNFPEFLKSDIDLCIKVDTFDFAMPVIKENGRHVMRAIKP